MNQNATVNLLKSLIQNPQDIQLAEFLLAHGFSIRDFFLYTQICALIKEFNFFSSSDRWNSSYHMEKGTE